MKKYMFLFIDGRKSSYIYRNLDWDSVMNVPNELAGKYVAHWDKTQGG